MKPSRRRRLRALSINVLVPNALTVLALCLGLSAMRLALLERWELAVAAVLVAGFIDGIDGRVARMLNVSSEFGAQLDSLSDFVCFGVAPASILYLWALRDITGLGAAVAMLFAVCIALRLARFNASLHKPDRPAWASKFFQGVPAPVAGAMALLPMVLSFKFGSEILAEPLVVGATTIVVALLAVSTIPTYSGKGVKIRHEHVMPLLLFVGILFAAIVGYPWYTLSVVAFGYMATIPISVMAHRRARIQATAVLVDEGASGIDVEMPESLALMEGLGPDDEEDEFIKR